MANDIKGYRSKPLGLYLLVFCFLLMFLATMIQPILRARAGAQEDVFSSVFFFQIFALGSAAVAILFVSRFSFFYLLGISTASMLFKISELFQTASALSLFDVFFVLFWLGFIVFFFVMSLHIPYLNPRTRWWKQPARFNFYAHGILFFEGYKFPVVTLDISAGGAFIKIDERALFAVEGVNSEKREEFLRQFGERRCEDPIGEVLLSDDELESAWNSLTHYPRKKGDKVKLQLCTLLKARQIYSKKLLETEAEVVWSTRESSVYRYGLGLRYIKLTPADQEKLRDYVRLLEISGYQKVR